MVSEVYSVDAGFITILHGGGVCRLGSAETPKLYNIIYEQPLIAQSSEQGVEVGKTWDNVTIIVTVENTVTIIVTSENNVTIIVTVENNVSRNRKAL